MFKFIFFLLFILTDNYAKSLIKEYLFMQNTTEIEKNKMYDRYSYKRSYLDKIRISAEFSEFDDIESKYALRVYPKKSSLIKLEESSYYLQKEELIDLYKNKSVKNLKLKYKNIIDAYFQNKILNQTHEMIEKYRKNIENLKNHIQNQSDIETISKMQLNINALKLSNLKIKHSLEKCINEIASVIDEKDNRKIKKELYNLHFKTRENILKNINKENLLIQNSKEKNYYQKELLKNKIAIKENKNSIALESVEIKYDDSKKTNKNLSLRLNIEIPFGKGADILSSKTKLLNMKEKILKEKSSIKIKITNLINDILFLNNYINNIEDYIVENGNFYEKYKTGNKLEYKFLIYLEKKDIEYRLDKIETEYKLYKKYLELLYLSGKLEIDKNQIFSFQKS